MKKFVKVISVLISVMLIVLSLVGCNETKNAQNTVFQMFESFKKLDFETARMYVNVDELQLSKDKSKNTVTNNQQMFMKSMFDKLQYTIVSAEKIDKNNVLVKVEVTAVDMKPVMGEYISEIFKISFANAFTSSAEKKSEEQQQKIMEDKFVGLVNKPDIAMISNTVDLKVQKVDKLWKVIPDETFVNALFGGLSEVAKDMEKSFNKIGEQN